MLGPAFVLTFCFCFSLLWKEGLGPSGTSMGQGKGHSCYMEGLGSLCLGISGRPRADP